MPDAPLKPAPVATRRACSADAQAIAGCLREVFAETYGAALPPEVLAAYLEREFATAAIEGDLARPEVFYLIAVVDRAIAGLSRLALLPPPAQLQRGAAVELAKLYVGAAFRGRGVAERLLEHSVELARAQGWPTIWLLVWEQNARALAFYRKHGFRAAGRASVFVEQIEFDDLILLRDVYDH